VQLARKSAAWAATAALLLALAGCGGGESTISLTKAQFLKEGNAICAKDNAEMTARMSAYLNRHAGRSRSEAIEEQAAVAVMLPTREKELHSLRTLGAPSGQEHYVDKMLAAWEEGIEKGEADPRSLLLAGPPYAFYKSYAMGNHYGLDKCWLG